MQIKLYIELDLLELSLLNILIIQFNTLNCG